MSGNKLLQKLADGGNVVVAEGYLYECERRGYLRAGSFVPEIVIEHPDMLQALHREWVHAGSDVVQAFTYYGHREKMRVAKREDETEKLNREALRIARGVADETGTMMAGNICNTTYYEPDIPSTHKEVEEMFKEQIEWAVEEGADFIIAETFGHYGEAAIALESIKKYGSGLPAVVTMYCTTNNITHDGLTVAECCRKLEKNGAAVVGVNCFKGPTTMLPVVEEIRKTCKGPIAALPVPYRTTESQPTFFSLTIPDTDTKAFPVELVTCLCSRADIESFSKSCLEIGVEYIGICCGNASHYMRIMAEVYGRNPPACKYSPNLKEHFVLGDHSRSKEHYTKTVKSEIM